jgi:hypothetical protein
MICYIQNDPLPRLAFGSGANHTLDTRLEGRPSTHLRHSGFALGAALRAPKPTFCAEGDHSRDTAVTENGLSCSDLRSHTATIGPACSAGTVSSRSRGKVN